MARTPRFTPDERKAIAERRRAATAGAKYGTGYYEQGYRDEPGKGRAFLMDKANKLAHGAFHPGSWLTKYDAAGNLIGIKARPNQSDRIAQWGSDWLDPSKVFSAGKWAAIQRTTGNSPLAQRRNAWIAANPGQGHDAWLYHKYVSRLPVDRATGQRVNKSGELYDPNKQFPNPLSGASSAAGPVPPPTGGTLASLVGLGRSDPSIPDNDYYRRRRRSLISDTDLDGFAGTL